MQGREKPLACGVVKDAAQYFIFLVLRSEAITVRQIEELAVDFSGKAYFSMDNHAAFLLKVVVYP